MSAPEISDGQNEDLIRICVQKVFDLSSAQEVIVFGSFVYKATHSHSDLDLVVIFEGVEELKVGQRLLFKNAHSFPIEVDFVCTERSTFEVQSKIGGVLMVALEDGRKFLRPRPGQVVDK